MIITFKIFENSKQEPKIGDYVICTLLDPDIINKNPILNDFLSNNIGKIIEIGQDRIKLYVVKYDNIPEVISYRFSHDNTRLFAKDDFLYFSSNKEDLEIYLNSKKYNI
jgi:hypothetical protein